MRRHLRVLVVEDDEDDFIIISQLLWEISSFSKAIRRDDSEGPRYAKTWLKLRCVIAFAFD